MDREKITRDVLLLLWITSMVYSAAVVKTDLQGGGKATFGISPCGAFLEIKVELPLDSNTKSGSFHVLNFEDQGDVYWSGPNQCRSLASWEEPFKTLYRWFPKTCSYINSMLGTRDSQSSFWDLPECIDGSEVWTGSATVDRLFECRSKDTGGRRLFTQWNLANYFPGAASADLHVSKIGYKDMAIIGWDGVIEMNHYVYDFDLDNSAYIASQHSGDDTVKAEIISITDSALERLRGGGCNETEFEISFNASFVKRLDTDGGDEKVYAGYVEYIDRKNNVSGIVGGIELLMSRAYNPVYGEHLYVTIRWYVERDGLPHAVSDTGMDRWVGTKNTILGIGKCGELQCSKVFWTIGSSSYEMEHSDQVAPFSIGYNKGAGSLTHVTTSQKLKIYELATVTYVYSLGVYQYKIILLLDPSSGNNGEKTFVTIDGVTVFDFPVPLLGVEASPNGESVPQQYPSQYVVASNITTTEPIDVIGIYSMSIHAKEWRTTDNGDTIECSDSVEDFVINFDMRKVVDMRDMKDGSSVTVASEQVV